MEQEYHVYRGLQKPFALFGLRGINVVWGAVAAIGGMILFAIFYLLGGFILGLLAAGGLIGFCVYKINFHIKYGLHDKDLMKGEWIVSGMIKPTYSGKVGKKKKK